MSRNQIAWWLWAAGSILIALSWFNVVSTSIGWLGFGIGMFGSVLSWGLRPPGRSAPARPATEPTNESSKRDAQ
jgi:hypothetical protein